MATTFMDGTCGVYRYSYNEEGVGYDKYEMSSTLLIGWWALLCDTRITEMYRSLLDRFPLPEGEENPYFSDVTIREQNPMFDAKNCYSNGMIECMVTLASKF